MKASFMLQYLQNYLKENGDHEMVCIMNRKGVVGFQPIVDVGRMTMPELFETRIALFADGEFTSTILFPASNEPMEPGKG